MEMWIIRFFFIVRFSLMDCQIYDHATCHKLLLAELFRQSDIFLKCQFILQGNVKRIGKLRLVVPFHMLHLVPEGFPVSQTLRHILRCQDFCKYHTRLACIIVYLVVITVKNPLPGNIGCGSDHHLSFPSGYMSY